jgi:MSHA biogenesis protein MshM
MYQAHFGLGQAPFKITPNTDFFFGGGNRGPILEALIYAVTHGEGIVKVTGEVGSGKTMLCNMLQQRLPEHVETVYIANPSVSPDEILHAIAFELQLAVERGSGRLEVMQTLQAYLVKRHAEGKRVVVFIEEAQSAPLATLEEIRLLSNLETRNDKLLQIVMFGQPELNDNLAETNIRQLRERIAHTFDLQPLAAGEVREYLMFRMRAAGYRGPDLFSQDVVKLVARGSGGLTRRINLIADKALLAAFSENTHSVKRRHVEAAVRDSEFSRYGQTTSTPRYVWITVAVLVGAALGAGGYFLVEYRITRAHVPAAPATIARTPALTNHTATPGVKAPAASSTSPIATVKIASATPAQAVPKSLLETRLIATNAWLVSAPDSAYSIQLLSAGDEEDLRNQLNNLIKSIEINDIFVYRSVSNRQPALTVLYGNFGNATLAADALAKLPALLKANRPLVRTVQNIRAEIRQYRGP